MSDAHAHAVEAALDTMLRYDPRDADIDRSSPEGWYRQVARERTDRVVRSYMARMEEAGFVMVPKEPTPAMLAASSRIPHARDAEIYAAMVATRPK